MSDAGITWDEATPLGDLRAIGRGIAAAILAADEMGDAGGVALLRERAHALMAEIRRREGDGSLRVIVCGGRHYGEKLDGKTREQLVAEVSHVRAVLDGLADALVPVVIVQGGARGADRRAREWAEHWKQKVVTFPADWPEHGRAAGPYRNRQMAAAGADLCVAFPGGRGTADMVAAATSAGIPVRDERANGPKEVKP